MNFLFINQRPDHASWSIRIVKHFLPGLALSPPLKLSDYIGLVTSDFFLPETNEVGVSKKKDKNNWISGEQWAKY